MVSEAADLSFSSSLPRVRLWLAFFIIALVPIGMPSVRWVRGDPPVQIPGTAPELVTYCAKGLAFWGVFFGLWWLLTRASRAQMFLRWQGWKIMALGVALSVGIRMAILSIMGALTFTAHFALLRMGMTPQSFDAALHANSRAEGIFVPLIVHGSPLHKALMLTLVSFVFAGMREELWRVLTMASLLFLAPREWGRAKRLWLALVTSSVLFGLGHVYQGWIGVVETGLIGLPLGFITLRRNSVWPAVLAHGCFDATTFLLIMTMAKK